MEYRRRIIDAALDELFPHLAAIALEGAKGVGKTATASQRARTRLDLADPNQRRSVNASYDLVAQLPTPVLVDEWQREPPVWDRVRKAVDDDSTGGRFLLAGSAGVSPGVRIHSGAGRIVSFTMRPLSFAERAVLTPTVSLRSLLSGGRPPITGNSTVDLPHYVDEILRSGFPGIRDLPARARPCSSTAIWPGSLIANSPRAGSTCAGRLPCGNGSVRMEQPRGPMPPTARSLTRLRRARTTSRLGRPSGPTGITSPGSSSSIPCRLGSRPSLRSGGSPIRPSTIWSTRPSLLAWPASVRTASCWARATALTTRG